MKNKLFYCDNERDIALAKQYFKVTNSRDACLKLTSVSCTDSPRKVEFSGKFLPLGLFLVVCQYKPCDRQKAWLHNCLLVALYYTSGKQSPSHPLLDSFRQSIILALYFVFAVVCLI